MSFFIEARNPGDIDSLADLLLSDMKNFPQVRELGENVSTLHTGGTGEDLG